jgi:RecJ-like exonuclease
MKFKKEKANQKKSTELYYPTDINCCVCCGAIIPEGALVCSVCEKGMHVRRCAICDKPLDGKDYVCSSCKNVVLPIKKNK